MKLDFSFLPALKISSNEPQRLFHGRGGLQVGYEFFSLDWLCPVLLVTLYKEQPAAWEKALIEALITAAPIDMESVVLQRRYQKPAVFETVYGPELTRFGICEQGLYYQLDFKAGMHSGLFLDMAKARQWVQGHAEKKRVLNLFSYTCAFSVAALAGGADSVVNIDLSRVSLSRGRDSHRLNEHDLSRVTFLGHDIFKSWGKLKRMSPFDLVIIDPPSYQKGSFVLAKDYVRVVKQLTGLLAKHADVLACLNDPDQPPEYLLELFAENCPNLRFQQRLPNPAAFVDQDEQKSLKVMHFKCIN